MTLTPPVEKCAQPRSMHRLHTIAGKPADFGVDSAISSRMTMVSQVGCLPLAREHRQRFDAIVDACSERLARGMSERRLRAPILSETHAAHKKNSGRTYRSAAARRQRSQRPGAYCHESPRRTHAPDRQRHPWFADTHEPGIHSKSWPFQCQRPSTHTYCMPRRARGRGGRGGVLIGGGRRGLRSTAPGGGWLPGRGGGGGRSSRANTRRGDTVHAAAMRVNARSTFRRVIHIAPVSC